MSDLFISHATVDDATVNHINNALTAAGINTWVDHVNGIGPSDRWPQQIQDALNACKYGLVILSRASAASPEVESEYRRVLKLGKLLYIALIESLPTPEFPYRLDIIQYSRLIGNDFESGTTELIRAITGQRDLDPQAPTTGQARRISGPFPQQQLDYPLIGRETDRQQIEVLLQNQTRVTAILGLGGVGKTRLAAEIAKNAAFRDGVVWHTIRPDTTVDHLTLLIRDHLGLDVTASGDTIWTALANRQMLIVLDNAEDCTQPQAYADVISRLDLTGGTRVLMTSRAQWRELRGARTHDLHAPDAESGVAILKEMVKQEPPAFPLDGHEPAIAQAARYHPRLMQYAVRWANSYPPDYVLNILHMLSGADAQEALDDMINKTIRQVEQRDGGPKALTALRRLAVCRGGFTFEAAQALMGNDDPHPLTLLKQWGLVSVISGRYDIDPLVLATSGEDESAHQAHYDHFYSLAKHHNNHQDYHGLDIESANLEAAFEWALRSGDGESAFWLASRCYHFLLNRGRFTQYMDWNKRTVKALQGIADERVSTAILNSLGETYRNLANREDRIENLLRAIAAFTKATQLFTPQTSSLDYAGLQHNLGLAYLSLAESEAPVENLGQAITAFSEALRFRTPQSIPLDYAATQNSLGCAFRVLAESEAPVENLGQAITAFSEALRFRTPQSTPLDYGETQTELGATYNSLGEIKDPVENLGQAITAFSEALRFRTPQSDPRGYATTQYGLGIAYHNLAMFENRLGNLRNAVDAYTEALSYRTSQSDPLGYAMIQDNLGDAYRDLGVPSEAAACWQEAEHYYRQMDALEKATRMRQRIDETSR